MSEVGADSPHGVPRPGGLVGLEEFDSFLSIRDFPPSSITDAVLKTVRDLDEREEFEPFVRAILFDSNATPHGPAEIVDILTHKPVLRGQLGLSAIILKGKSFPTVRPAHVSHQIYRLKKIADLRVAILAASGTVLDAVKEQFCATATRLDCNYTILDAVDVARLFVAYGFICPRDGRRTSAGRCACGYSPQKRILNLLQVESLRALATARELKQRSGLLVLPTGSGKTRIAAEDAKQSDAKHVLCVGHTHEILDVAQSEFEAVFTSRRVTRHTSSKTLARPSQANLTTIQLLRNHIRKLNGGIYDYVIVDEFHHATAPSYREAIKVLSPNFLLGLTATPFRGDRPDIAALCEGNVLADFNLRYGIEAGILSPYHYFGCFDDIDYSKIAHNGVHYVIRDLEKDLVIPERNQAIINMWKKHAEGKPTLAFCCSHEHANRMVAYFRNSGVPAAAYLSKTSLKDRRSLEKRLRTGTVKILCSVDVLNEGADIPFIECLLFLGPTESQRIFYQQLGRGLRRYFGKSHCTIIDFIGNFKNAFKIAEYQGLLPVEGEESVLPFRNMRAAKEVLNLPLGCKVNFDDRVIDVFAKQVFDPRSATRHNIGRILIYQYQSLGSRLGHSPTRKEVDRNLLLGSAFYRMVFGSWESFEDMNAKTEASATTLD
jgi:superfamily II DNA or RNA helicase